MKALKEKGNTWEAINVLKRLTELGEKEALKSGSKEDRKIMKEARSEFEKWERILKENNKKR